MKVVEGLYYTKDHEWVKLDGDIAYIGITDYAQEALGDIVFVELPEEDAEFYEEDGFTVIESVKAASDVFMPIAGTVKKVNEKLEDEPEALNDAPFENFIIAITEFDKSKVEALMTAEEYKAYCQGLE